MLPSFLYQIRLWFGIYNSPSSDICSCRMQILSLCGVCLAKRGLVKTKLKKIYLFFLKLNLIILVCKFCWIIVLKRHLDIWIFKWFFSKMFLTKEQSLKVTKKIWSNLLSKSFNVKLQEASSCCMSIFFVTCTLSTLD